MQHYKDVLKYNISNLLFEAWRVAFPLQPSLHQGPKALQSLQQQETEPALMSNNNKANLSEIKGFSTFM